MGAVVRGSPNYRTLSPTTRTGSGSNPLPRRLNPLPTWRNPLPHLDLVSLASSEVRLLFDRESNSEGMQSFPRSQAALLLSSVLCNPLPPWLRGRKKNLRRESSNSEVVSSQGPKRIEWRLPHRGNSPSDGIVIQACWEPVTTYHVWSSVWDGVLQAPRPKRWTETRPRSSDLFSNSDSLAIPRLNCPSMSHGLLLARLPVDGGVGLVS